ncbi:MAG: hypothetical protein GEU86_21970 [Actinophytocola sp.]|nr:hypothetical protein [Actinophytocola sp.]
MPWAADHGPIRHRASSAVVLALVMVIGVMGVQACTSASLPPPAAEDLPASIPEGFPLPPGAEVVGGGADAAIRVPELTVDEVVGFYHRELGKAGWKIVDNWQGADPQGRSTSGMTIEHGEHTGALAVIDTPGDTVLLRINLAQPTAPSSSAGGDKDDDHGEHDHG